MTIKRREFYCLQCKKVQVYTPNQKCTKCKNTNLKGAFLCFLLGMTPFLLLLIISIKE